MSLMPKIFPRDDGQKISRLMQDLLHREAKIGGSVFGPVPKGHHREFFCLDEHTWVWHEEWIENGTRRIVTTRYDVRPNGVLKSQNGQAYQRLSFNEARNLYRAAKLYTKRVGNDYGMPVAM
jgi:hypothetical protein